MPRLTRRAFTDLAIWMVGFGLLIGLVFPPFCLLLGLPQGQILTPLFFVTTLAAGLVVGGVNYFLARAIVGVRLRTLSSSMTHVESELRRSALEGDLSGCDPEACRILVDSEDELGASAAAFNGLLEAVYRSRLAEVELRDYLRELSAHLELDDLGPAALDGIVRIGGFAGGALVVDVDGETQVIASRAILDSTRSPRPSMSGGRSGRARRRSSRSRPTCASTAPSSRSRSARSTSCRSRSRASSSGSSCSRRASRRTRNATVS